MIIFNLNTALPNIVIYLMQSNTEVLTKFLKIDHRLGAGQISTCENAIQHFEVGRNH